MSCQSYMTNNQLVKELIRNFQCENSQFRQPKGDIRTLGKKLGELGKI